MAKAQQHAYDLRRNFERNLPCKYPTIVNVNMHPLLLNDLQKEERFAKAVRGPRCPCRVWSEFGNFTGEIFILMKNYSLFLDLVVCFHDFLDD